MKETLEFLYSLRNQGSKFGIERMRMLCERLKNPQLSYPSIHVAGTNGKGSVCTMLSKIYRNHGYKVGLFTSPHLLHLGERVSVNGKSLSFSEIEKWVDR
ncbi:MAG: bifunctional folylpolyglutamate synthase/dihydrofolate synthase, partial [Opitutales bacterium]|nr:bifunctional folylpolyglutamate synthase/dihydrofolate synthase [Opitutales bacterium]